VALFALPLITSWSLLMRSLIYHAGHPLLPSSRPLVNLLNQPAFYWRLSFSILLGFFLPIPMEPLLNLPSFFFFFPHGYSPTLLLPHRRIPPLPSRFFVPLFIFFFASLGMHPTPQTPCCTRLRPSPCVLPSPHVKGRPFIVPPTFSLWPSQESFLSFLVPLRYGIQYFSPPPQPFKKVDLNYSAASPRRLGTPPLDPFFCTSKPSLQTCQSFLSFRPPVSVFSPPPFPSQSKKRPVVDQSDTRLVFQFQRLSRFRWATCFPPPFPPRNVVLKPLTFMFYCDCGFATPNFTPRERAPLWVGIFSLSPIGL